MLVLLFSKLAPVEEETNVMMPQTKAVLYHLSKEVCAAVSCILGKPANWQPALYLIVLDVKLLNLRY